VEPINKENFDIYIMNPEQVVRISALTLKDQAEFWLNQRTSESFLNAMQKVNLCQQLQLQYSLANFEAKKLNKKINSVIDPT
jgi:hypothetical protein